MTAEQGLVLNCEHTLCEFTDGHPLRVEHSFMIGQRTRLDVCQECYTYFIGSIIKEEIEHFAKRTALHSRHGAISLLDAVESARSMSSIPGSDIVAAIRRFLDNLINPSDKAQAKLEDIGVTRI